MKTRAIYGGIAVILLLIIGFILYNQSQNRQQDQTESASDQALPVNQDGQMQESDEVAMEPGDTPPPTTAGQFSGESDIMAPDIQVYEVIYDGQQYSPSSLDIKQGDVVIFRNNSSGNFWPASAFHPTHEVYPEFDPKKPIAAGETFEFKFTKVGEWKYHDHIKPSATGVINVSQ